MRICLLIWIFLLVFCHMGFGQKDQLKQELTQKLAELEFGDERLDVLFQLTKLTQPDPSEQVIYIKQLLQEAQKVKNNRYTCEAYLFYMFQAYNTYNPDEANKWMALLEPLARKEKLYDLLFRGKQCVVDLLLMNEEYELEEKEALLMLSEAQELDNIIGQISAYHSLSHVYMITYRNEEAFEVLKKAIELGPQCTNLWLYEEVIRTMTRLCERMKDFPNWFKYQQLLDEVLVLIEKKYPLEKLENEQLLNYVSYLRYYTFLKEWDQAARYLELARTVYSDEYAVVYRYYYLMAKAFYYNEIKNWYKALEQIEQVLVIIEPLSSVDYIANLPVKASLLSFIGREKEALEIYKEAKSLKDSLVINIVDKQARQLEKSYMKSLDVLDRESQNQRYQLFFLVLAGLVTSILVISIIHALRVKYKLAKAEQEMREMMNETEQANQIKNRLLSNINMSIRPDLEVIVNSSSKLASEEGISIEKKEELSRIVTTRADHLMKMINDILLLSKLEAKMMKFTVDEINICLAVRSWVEIAQQSRMIGASIPENVEYKVRVDEVLLQQVIESLLDSPIDMDKEITLRLEESKDSQVVITVLNSMLSTGNPSQNIVIRNEINRMLIESFSGDYILHMNSDVPCVVIKLNSEPASADTSEKNAFI